MAISLTWSSNSINKIVANDGFNDTEYSADKLVKILTPEFLPPCVRWHDHFNRFFVVELPPRVVATFNARYTSYKMDANGNYARDAKNNHIVQPGVVDIPIPWQVYFVDTENSSELRVWFRNEQLTSFEDMVYYPWMANTYMDCRPCGMQKPHIKSSMTAKDKIFTIINQYWMTPFSGASYFQGSGRLPEDLREIVKKMPKTTRGRGYGDDDWHTNIDQEFAKMSIEDILKFILKPVGTLGEQIKELTKYEPAMISATLLQKLREK